MIPLEKLPDMARSSRQEHAKLLKRLSSDTGKLDDWVHAIHEEVFDTINCLDCANCCRTLGPRVTDADVRRITTSLRMKPSVFVSQYLVMDEEGDFIFRSMPCPFLSSDNFCSIYNVRPKACREYPHTNRRRFYQVMNLTLTNSSTCPAVFEILTRLKKESNR
jgi:Fe-S-cluster containining protein